MQTVLDHYGRTPITAFIDGIAKEDTPRTRPEPESRLIRPPWRHCQPIALSVDAVFGPGTIPLGGP